MLTAIKRKTHFLSVYGRIKKGREGRRSKKIIKGFKKVLNIYETKGLHFFIVQKKAKALLLTIECISDIAEIINQYKFYPY